MTAGAKRSNSSFGLTLLAFVFVIGALIAFVAPTTAHADTVNVSNPLVTLDESTNEYSSTWDCVWFGSYPQSEVPSTDSVYGSLASANWDEHGDAWIGTARYRRILPSDAASSDTWPSGFTGYRYFKWEPIKWRVLNVSDGTAFLLADKALDERAYNASDDLISWDYCTLRSWLNGFAANMNDSLVSYRDEGFIDLAFSSEEKGGILTTESGQNDNPKYHTYGGQQASDRLFLPSAYDVCSDATIAPTYGFSKYESASATRYCEPTDYANAMGASRTDDGLCSWLLRSPGSPTQGNQTNKVAYVISSGRMMLGGGSASSHRGVRPALTLDLTSPCPTSAGTVSSDGSVDENAPTGTHGDEGGFVLGRDNNSFAHHYDPSVKPAAGFQDVSNYELDLPYLNELYRRADKGERSAIREALYGTWGGSCYGIATSMAMVFEGYTSLSDLATMETSSYYELSYPCHDKTLLNNIQYYQLSQSIDTNESRLAHTIYEDIKNQIFNVHYDTDTLQEFLEKLVNRFRKHHTLIFSYVHGDTGHAILVTDCSFNSAEERFELTMYDENCIFDVGDLGSFGTMYVASDFSSFTYVNHRGEIALTSGSTPSDAHYNMMAVTDPVDLDYLVPDPTLWQSEIWSSGNLPPNAYEIDELGRVRIRFPMGVRFTISNLKGDKLTCDGGTLSGDMGVHDIDFECMDDGASGGFYTIEVDSSEAFEVSGIDGDVDISAYDAENFLSVSGDGISGVSMTLGQGSVIHGDDYSFCAFASTEEEVRPGESGLVSVSGRATGDVAISSSGDTVTATSDEEMRSVVTASYAGVDRTQAEVGDTKVAEMRAERVTAPEKPSDDGNGSGKDDKDADSKPPVAKEPGIAVGQTARSAGSTYKATGASTVAFVKAKNTKSVTVPATVSLNGKTYSVTSIAKNSFKGSKIRKVTIGKNVSKIAKGAFGKSKVKTVVVKSKKLKKASSVKGSFSGSKAKKVTVKYGKLGKKYVRKSFTAKNTKAKKMVITK